MHIPKHVQPHLIDVRKRDLEKPKWWSSHPDFLSLQLRPLRSSISPLLQGPSSPAAASGGSSSRPPTPVERRYGAAMSHLPPSPAHTHTQGSAPTNLYTGTAATHASTDLLRSRDGALNSTRGLHSPSSASGAALPLSHAARVVVILDDPHLAAYDMHHPGLAALPPNGPQPSPEMLYDVAMALAERDGLTFEEAVGKVNVPTFATATPTEPLAARRAKVEAAVMEAGTFLERLCRSGMIHGWGVGVTGRYGSVEAMTEVVSLETVHDIAAAAAAAAAARSGGGPTAAAGALGAGRSMYAPAVGGATSGTAAMLAAPSGGDVAAAARAARGDSLFGRIKSAVIGRGGATTSTSVASADGHGEAGEGAARNGQVTVAGHRERGSIAAAAAAHHGASVPAVASHFGYVHAPFNLSEGAALTSGFLDMAKQLNLTTVGSRPLSTRTGSGYEHRWHSYVEYGDVPHDQNIKNLLHLVGSIEISLQYQTAGVAAAPDPLDYCIAMLCWLQREELANLHRLRQARTGGILPRAQKGWSMLLRLGDENVARLVRLHQRALPVLLRAWEKKYEARHAVVAEYVVAERLREQVAAFKAASASITLSQMALSTALSAGFDCVVTGMKDPLYVRQALDGALPLLSRSVVEGIIGDPKIDWWKLQEDVPEDLLPLTFRPPGAEEPDIFDIIDHRRVHRSTESDVWAKEFKIAEGSIVPSSLPGADGSAADPAAGAPPVGGIAWSGSDIEGSTRVHREQQDRWVNARPRRPSVWLDPQGDRVIYPHRMQNPEDDSELTDAQLDQGIKALLRVSSFEGDGAAWHVMRDERGGLLKTSPVGGTAIDVNDERLQIRKDVRLSTDAWSSRAQMDLDEAHDRFEDGFYERGPRQLTVGGDIGDRTRVVTKGRGGTGSGVSAGDSEAGGSAAAAAAAFTAAAAAAAASAGISTAIAGGAGPADPAGAAAAAAANPEASGFVVNDESDGATDVVSGGRMRPSEALIGAVERTGRRVDYAMGLGDVSPYPRHVSTAAGVVPVVGDAADVASIAHGVTYGAADPTVPADFTHVAGGGAAGDGTGRGTGHDAAVSAAAAAATAAYAAGKGQRIAAAAAAAAGATAADPARDPEGAARARHSARSVSREGIGFAMGSSGSGVSIAEGSFADTKVIDEIEESGGGGFGAVLGVARMGIGVGGLGGITTTEQLQNNTIDNVLPSPMVAAVMAQRLKQGRESLRSSIAASAAAGGSGGTAAASGTASGAGGASGAAQPAAGARGAAPRAGAGMEPRRRTATDVAVDAEVRRRFSETAAASAGAGAGADGGDASGAGDVAADRFAPTAALRGARASEQLMLQSRRSSGDSDLNSIVAPQTQAAATAARSAAVAAALRATADAASTSPTASDPGAATGHAGGVGSPVVDGGGFAPLSPSLAAERARLGAAAAASEALLAEGTASVARDDLIGRYGGHSGGLDMGLGGAQPAGAGRSSAPDSQRRLEADQDARARERFVPLDEHVAAARARAERARGIGPIGPAGRPASARNNDDDDDAANDAWARIGPHGGRDEDLLARVPLARESYRGMPRPSTAGATVAVAFDPIEAAAIKERAVRESNRAAYMRALRESRMAVSVETGRPISAAVVADTNTPPSRDRAVDSPLNTSAEDSEMMRVAKSRMRDVFGAGSAGEGAGSGVVGGTEGARGGRARVDAMFAPLHGATDAFIDARAADDGAAAASVLRSVADGTAPAPRSGLGVQSVEDVHEDRLLRRVRAQNALVERARRGEAGAPRSASAPFGGTTAAAASAAAGGADAAAAARGGVYQREWTETGADTAAVHSPHSFFPGAARGASVGVASTASPHRRVSDPAGTSEQAKMAIDKSLQALARARRAELQSRQTKLDTIAFPQVTPIAPLPLDTRPETVLQTTLSESKHGVTVTLEPSTAELPKAPPYTVWADDHAPGGRRRAGLSYWKTQGGASDDSDVRRGVRYTDTHAIAREQTGQKPLTRLLRGLGGLGGGEGLGGGVRPRGKDAN